MEVNGQLHAPAALPPGKEPPVLKVYGSFSAYLIKQHDIRSYTFLTNFFRIKIFDVCIYSK
jgi:hypothetical protein